MTALEKLAELRANLEHLESLRAKQTLDEEALRRDRSLRNDVCFALLMACQAVIDVAAEIASRHAVRFHDYTEAVRALREVDGFNPELVARLEPLPGFRNVVVHQYVELDYGRVVDALGELDAIREFVRIAARRLE